jgi:hypothetical protein
MDLILNRESSDENGTFSTLYLADGTRLCVAAEHAYLQLDGSWKPKIPTGKYRCQRGTHQLEAQPPFVTFEVLAVPGHSGILFHKGNLPEVDSAGCILLGTSFGAIASAEAVLGSANAFAAFLQTQAGVDEFQLTVS